MAKEIERKFLVTSEAWRRHIRKAVAYRQGYMANNEKVSVRVRISDDDARLNIKSATLGVYRLEYEYSLPLNDAQQMLDELCMRPLIEKTRYYVDDAGHTWEVDVFEGDNAGLVVAELELDDEDAPYTRPDWVGEEVSDDPRYYNVCLVEHPYKDWDARG